MDKALRDTLRMRTRHFYDLQKLRIALGNRALDPEDYVEVVNKKTGKTKKKKKVTLVSQMNEALEQVIEQMRGSETVNLEVEVEGEAVLLQPSSSIVSEDDRRYYKQQSRVLELLEKQSLDEIHSLLKGEYMYRWLRKEPGCGPTMSAVILSEVQMCEPADMHFLAGKPRNHYTVVDQDGREWKYFSVTFIDEVPRTVVDEETGERTKVKVKVQKTHVYVVDYDREGNERIRRDICPTVSSLWAYAGYAVNTSNNTAVRREKGVQFNWNPWLKTKLFVLAGCMLLMGDRSPRHEVFANAKHRWESEGRGIHISKKDGLEKRRHLQLHATRVLIKSFLRDLWEEWRKHEGLPVLPPYSVAVLGRTHGDHRGRVHPVRHLAPEVEAAQVAQARKKKRQPREHTLQNRP